MKIYTSRRGLVRKFSITLGFLEDLERKGIIQPKTIYKGKLPYKEFTAKDIEIIKQRALASQFRHCRQKGKRMRKVLEGKG